MSSATNATTFRILRYPAITHKLKEGQLRCGKHTDYGSITLLFQDNVGGLEVSDMGENPSVWLDCNYLCILCIDRCMFVTTSISPM